MIHCVVNLSLFLVTVGVSVYVFIAVVQSKENIANYKLCLQSRKWIYCVEQHLNLFLIGLVETFIGWGWMNSERALLSFQYFHAITISNVGTVYQFN